MSYIESNDLDVQSDADRLNKMLETPEPSEGPAEVPVKPAPVRTQQRNTVEPTPQESAPEEASAGEEQVEEDISPPASWDAEAKEKWAKLPPDVREIISHREAERERAINTKLQETAELRKQAELEASQTLQYRQAYEQRLNHYAKQLEANIPDEFRTITSAVELQRLAERDPAAAQRFLIWRETAASTIKELEALEQHKALEFRQLQEKTLTREAEALVAKWPEVADPVKGPVIKNEISTLLKDFGFSESEISGISDHRILLFAKQYMEGQKALKANVEAAKKVQGKPLPKVQVPGKGESTGPTAKLNTANLHRVARSGDQGSTVAALEKLLSQ